MTKKVRSSRGMKSSFSSKMSNVKKGWLSALERAEPGGLLHWNHWALSELAGAKGGISHDYLRVAQEKALDPNNRSF